MEIKTRVYRYSSKNWLAYTEIKPKRYKYTILILLPGAEDESLLSYIYKLFPKSCRIICMGYPSRGNSSTSLSNSNIGSISVIISRFTKEKLKSENIILVGMSFGTSIATKILQNSRIYNIRYCILVNPGEFFSDAPTKLFKKIFTPALDNINYAKQLKKIITSITPITLQDHDKNRLKAINLQWISTLNYKIDTKTIVKTPTVIINSSFDFIIKKESREKIMKVFLNSKSIYYKGTHFFNYRSPHFRPDIKSLAKEINKYMQMQLAEAYKRKLGV